MPLATTPCQFGGVRWWLKCPCCGRRVRSLYLRWSGFTCRHCAWLTYTSTQTWDRRVRAVVRRGFDFAATVTSRRGSESDRGLRLKVIEYQRRALERVARRLGY